MALNKVNIFGVYDDEDLLVSSIKKLQDEGYSIKDVVSPYPIHKVFEMLNLKTRIPMLAFFYGLFAVIVTFIFLYWTSVVNYPLTFGGKPQATLSFIIVIFVMTINITSVLTIITFFLREKKGPGAKPVYDLPGITDDRFLIVIEKHDGMKESDSEAINKLMKVNGAVDVTEIVELNKNENKH